MQVNAYRSNQTRVSFSSERFFPVVVRDLKGLPVKAWFSKLIISDTFDTKGMKKVNDIWTKEKGVYYADDIYKKFEEGKPVYAVELVSTEGTLYDRLLCIASIHKEKKTFKLDYIQSSTNSSFNSSNEKRQYKGAGTALMYGLVKIAEKGGSNLFKLFSATADSFYEKLGMVENSAYMTFDRFEMIDFLKRQESEFKALLQKQHQKTDEIKLIS